MICTYLLCELLVWLWRFRPHASPLATALGGSSILSADNSAGLVEALRDKTSSVGAIHSLRTTGSQAV